MQVKSIAECSNGSILQYFWPSLSYHLSLRSLFCLCLSGSLRQVLLYLLFTTICLWLESCKLTLFFASWEIFPAFLSSTLKIKFFEKIISGFSNMIRVSNSLDADHARDSAGPDLIPNCLQKLSADNTRGQRVWFVKISSVIRDEGITIKMISTVHLKVIDPIVPHIREIKVCVHRYC